MIVGELLRDSGAALTGMNGIFLMYIGLIVLF
jgi:hypothetical protein